MMSWTARRARRGADLRCRPVEDPTKGAGLHLVITDKGQRRLEWRPVFCTWIDWVVPTGQHQISEAEAALRQWRYLGPIPDGADGCRVCGCTDDDCSDCIRRTGGPCHWVEADRCSACAQAPPL